MVIMVAFSACETHSKPLIADVEEGASKAARYLSAVVMADGKFKYQINSNPEALIFPSYNMLRHAGAIHAMIQYYQRNPDDKLKESILRAGRFLKTETLDSVEKEPGLMTIWSEPSITKSKNPRESKLGGTGLGLVALTGIEKIQPGFTPIEDLRALGRFILFMQNEDGSFVSKYSPEKGGKTDTWKSLFYPGEATLGLINLYQIDPNPIWIESAIRSLEYLSEKRKNTIDFPVDHWALIATAELLNLNDIEQFHFSRELIIYHSLQITEKILSEQLTKNVEKNMRGAFTANWATTPTATRLEGLTAVLAFLPDTSGMYTKILTSCELGINYLLHAQVTSGNYIGAFTHNIEVYKDKSEGRKKQWGNTDIRIDYVQHALSALIQYLNIAESNSGEES